MMYYLDELSLNKFFVKILAFLYICFLLLTVMRKCKKGKNKFITKILYYIFLITNSVYSYTII